MEQISSTEELRDYMHVTNPRMWIILSAVLILIVGFIVFAGTVTMENTITVPAEVSITEIDGGQYNDIIITVPESVEEIIKKGMPVTIAKETGSIYGIAASVDSASTTALVILDDKSIILPPGNYDAKVILERISPFSFLFN
mgnify:FL=1